MTNQNHEDCEAVRVRIFGELKRHGLVKPAAPEEPIPRETHRAVVQQVLERAWTAERELKETLRRLHELDLCYQATLADIAAERLKVLKLEKERAEACKNAGYWMQRAEGNKHNYDKGRASALVEVMQLLEGDLEDHDLYVYDVYRSIIEQVRGIKP